LTKGFTVPKIMIFGWVSSTPEARFHISAKRSCRNVRPGGQASPPGSLLDTEIQSLRKLDQTLDLSRRTRAFAHGETAKNTSSACPHLGPGIPAGQRAGQSLRIIEPRQRSCAYLEGSCCVGWSATRTTFDVLGGTLLAPPEVPVEAQIVLVERFVVGPVQYRKMCSPVANFFTATGQQFPQESYVLKRYMFSMVYIPRRISERHEDCTQLWFKHLTL
jgi:hypothetical protein